jgi:hypothetical protein
MITASLNPSEEGTEAYTISYVAEGNPGNPNKGVVLDLKINTQLNYSKIILKNQHYLRGYTPFRRDPFYNLIQTKTINSTKIPLLKSELSHLVGIESKHRI